MKKHAPRHHLNISWIIMGIGVLLALIGAALVRNYQLNLWLLIGGIVIVCGIAYHLVMVRCPHCGHSLAGYRPLPEVCPQCRKAFKDT